MSHCMCNKFKAASVSSLIDCDVTTFALLPDWQKGKVVGPRYHRKSAWQGNLHYIVLFGWPAQVNLRSIPKVSIICVRGGLSKLEIRGRLLGGHLDIGLDIQP